MDIQEKLNKKIEISEYKSLSMDLNYAKSLLEKDEQIFGKDSAIYQHSLKEYQAIKSKFDAGPKPPIISPRTRNEIISYIVFVFALALFSWYVTSHYGVETKKVMAKVYHKDGRITYKEVDQVIGDEWFGTRRYVRTNRFGHVTKGTYNAWDRFFDLFIKLTVASIVLRLAYMILRNNKIDHNPEPFGNLMYTTLKEQF